MIKKGILASPFFMFKYYFFIPEIFILSQIFEQKNENAQSNR